MVVTRFMLFERGQVDYWRVAGNDGPTRHRHTDCDPSGANDDHRQQRRRLHRPAGNTDKSQKRVWEQLRHRVDHAVTVLEETLRRPAIYRNCRTVDEFRSIRTQKGNDVTKVVGVADLAGWRLGKLVTVKLQ